MECSICGKEKVTLVVPPDKPICYCLSCIHDDLSKNRQLPEEAEHVGTIARWLEWHRHMIPEARLSMGEPLRIVENVPPPPKWSKK